MAAAFVNPAAAPVAAFGGQLKTFDAPLGDFQDGTAPKQFVNPAAAPVAAFAGQLKQFG